MTRRDRCHQNVHRSAFALVLCSCRSKTRLACLLGHHAISGHAFIAARLCDLADLVEAPPLASVVLVPCLRCLGFLRLALRTLTSEYIARKDAEPGNNQKIIHLQGMTCSEVDSDGETRCRKRPGHSVRMEVVLVSTADVAVAPPTTQPGSGTFCGSASNASSGRVGPFLLHGTPPPPTPAQRAEQATFVTRLGELSKALGGAFAHALPVHACACLARFAAPIWAPYQPPQSKGATPGPSGLIFEMLRVAIDAKDASPGRLPSLNCSCHWCVGRLVAINAEWSHVPRSGWLPAHTRNAPLSPTGTLSTAHGSRWIRSQRGGVGATICRNVMIYALGT